MQVPYVEIQNIDFASAKRKKRELDNNLTSPSALRRLTSQPQEQAVTPTEEEKLGFFKAISETGSRSSVLSIIPTFCDDFVPKQQLPMDLTTLFDVEALELQFHELLTRCAEMEEDIIVTDEMAHNVEKMTRDQSSSKEWFTYRSGRITASRMKSACHTDPAKPSLSLINSICYPNKFRFTNEAT
ncbi:uncharacterized protein LOC117125296, partial [Anneissia japonica]|uniref:uncharacterized protein LOC117125296 n=1 Tax=Anneissia japonica TaxID=1529436 RepID=UPI00142560C3